MNRLVGWVVAGSAAVALVAAAPVTAAEHGAGPGDAVAAKKKKKKKKKKSATTVTADLRHFQDGEIIEGFVDGAKSFCSAEFVDRPVQIYREAGAQDVLVAEATARLDPPPFGFFETGTIPPQSAGTQFYVVAPKQKVTKKKICLEGSSPVVTVP